MNKMENREEFKFKNKEPNLKMVVSIICSKEFRNKFNLAIDKTRQSKKENLFYVAKKFKESGGFISSVYAGKKTKVDTEHIYDECYDSDKMEYTYYPLITVHTHPNTSYLCPSVSDMYALLCISKEYAKREFFKINSIAIIINTSKEIETMLFQDKSNLLDSLHYYNFPWKGSKAEGTTQDSIENFYTKVDKMIKHKTIATDKIVQELQKIGFEVSSFKGDYNKNIIIKALKKFDFMEEDMVMKQKYDNFNDLSF